jgi:hypothetical protein
MHMDPAPGEHPGRTLMSTYQRDLAMLPGITLISWKLENPNVVELRFEDHQLLRLAQGVLKDAVNGASWVFSVEEGAAPLPSAPANGRAPWYERPQNIAMAMQALPGVEDILLDKQAREFVLVAHDEAVAEHLRPLLRNHLGDMRMWITSKTDVR